MRLKQRGFTLLEVLVAMAVFAVVSLTLLKSSSQQVSHSASMEDRLIAHWVAGNTLTDLQTNGNYPDVGEIETSTVMARRDWFITIKVAPTPSSDVRHVTVSVAPYDPEVADIPSPVVSNIGFVRKQQRGRR